MKLSIIVPYFNNNAWVGKTLDSLMDQDLDPTDYEIVVIDDGSEEEPVVLKDYAARCPQIHYHRVEHAGVAAARNFGLGQARGDWVIFCDSDDFVQPRVFGGIIAAAEERGLEMIWTKRQWLNPTDQATAPRRNFDVLSDTVTGFEYICHPSWPFSLGVGSYLFKRSVALEHQIKFKRIWYVEDRLFVMDLVQNVTRMAYIDVDLYCYVQHEVSITHSGKRLNGPAFVDAQFVFLERIKGLADDTSVPARTVETLRLWCSTESYVALIHAFRYCPVKDTVKSISRLKDMGLYPLGVSDHKLVQRFRPLMNARGLWIFMCRCYHLLPKRLRR